MMNVYFISGIGADRRLFKYIRLPAGDTASFIDWVPHRKGETLPEYAIRLAAGIDTAQPFVLVGLSLGGIAAVEIAKRFQPAATIIIGSVPRSSQLPAYYRLARRLGIIRLVPPAFFKVTASFKRLFTRESLADKKDLLKMIWEGNSEFIKWAMLAVLDWENEIIPQPFWHLHGTRDEVFPIQLLSPTHTIPRGATCWY